MSGIPTISVIIPLYNKGAYVGRAVESALSQSTSPFEVLVIDDGSTDDGPARLKAYAGDPRLRLIRQANGGEGAARNRGLSEMRGDVAAFLDADDEWLPGHLEAIAELAQRFPEAGLLATGYRSIWRRGLAVETTLSSGVPTLIHNYFEIARGTYPVHISSAAVRKHVAEQTGGFPTAEPWMVDMEFYTRVALKWPIAYHPAITGVYNGHIPGSVANVLRWNNRMPLVVRSLQPLLATAPAGITSSIERFLACVLVEHVLLGLCANRRTDAVRLMAEFFPRDAAAARELRLCRLAARWAPVAGVRLLMRLQRSRYGVRSRNGVVNRVLPLNDRPTAALEIARGAAA